MEEVSNKDSGHGAVVQVSIDIVAGVMEEQKKYVLELLEVKKKGESEERLIYRVDGRTVGEVDVKALNEGADTRFLLYGPCQLEHMMTQKEDYEVLNTLNPLQWSNIELNAKKEVLKSEVPSYFLLHSDEPQGVYVHYKGIVTQRLIKQRGDKRTWVAMFPWDVSFYTIMDLVHYGGAHEITENEFEKAWYAAKSLEK